MRFLLAFMIASLIASPGIAQSDSETTVLEFEGHQFTVAAQDAEIEDYLDREALIFSFGRLWLADSNFTDGVIEFDIAFDDRFGFAGVIWRGSEDGDREYLYARTGNSGAGDALQYTPIHNGNSAWQIYTDGNAQAAPGFTYEGWNHVRLVVVGDQADVFINGATEPTLHIPDLQTERRNGQIGFQVSGRHQARFSKIIIRPLGPGDMIIGTAEPTVIPQGTISDWSVSTAFAEGEVSDRLELSPNWSSTSDWQRLAVESHGIANISRILARSRETNTVYLATQIVTASPQRKRMRFGYSDRLRLFLNGQLIFDGDSGWRARDFRFLGTIGLFDAVVLDLQPGENVLTDAVSETFGGWGWLAAIEDRNGIAVVTFDPAPES